MKKIYRIIQISFVLLISIHFSWGQSDAPKPPSGFLNNTIMKIAYGLGAIKLIDKSPPIPESLVVYKDLIYKETNEKSLKLDIYRHNSIQKPAPLLVFIHGGSWRSGDKDDYRRYLVDFAEKGYVTATISYRLSKEAVFPAAFDDVVCAIKWLKLHASDYYINPDKIAVIGGSAGGHLAMMLAYHSNDSSYVPECDCDGDSKVQAIVNIYGPCDLTTEIAINTSSVIKFVGKEYSEETKELYDAISPLQFITQDDPPTLIFHGTIDDIVPVEQSDKLAEALKQTNIPYDYHKLKGWPHVMDMGFKVNEYCQYYMDQFFSNYLK